MPKKKNKNPWQTTQPPFNEEIVIFANHVRPSYHFIKWLGEGDWDIKLGHGVFIGPRNFEGGGQFVPDVKDKEFFWMPRKEFLKKTKKIRKV